LWHVSSEHYYTVVLIKFSVYGKQDMPKFHMGVKFINIDNYEVNMYEQLKVEKRAEKTETKKKYREEVIYLDSVTYKRSVD